MKYKSVGELKKGDTGKFEYAHEQNFFPVTTFLDALVKQNIIKKNKVIVDMGSRHIKMLGVNYTAKKITVTNAHKFDSDALFREGEMNYTDLVRGVEKILGNKKHMELSISLPACMVEYKIVSIKNRKAAEIGKYIEKEHSAFGKVSPLTHEIDFACLGSREENGDSIHYCLVAAVSKSGVNQLLDEFGKRKLKVTTVSFPVNDLICLSQLFSDDYEHLSRLMIDFGASGTRVVAFSDGVPVYARNISIGFNSYIERLFSAQDSAGKPELTRMVSAIGEMTVLTNEQIKRYFAGLEQRVYYDVVNDISSQLARDIFRVIELCGNNQVPVTKIIYGGFMINGFENRLKSNGIETEKFDLNLTETKTGKNFALQIGNANVDCTFNNALGLAVHTLL